LSPRILWIDDQVNVIETFALLLAPIQADVVFEQSAEKGVSRIRKEVFDLVLVDLNMPPGKWGGLWVLEAVSTLDKNTPIIVVSGEGSQRETIKAIRLGAVDYITKEGIEEELLPRVQEVLKREAALRLVIGESTLELIKRGESDTTEFKSTLRWNLRAQRKDPVIELSAIKSVAGFLNARGGVLLLGVDDEGQVLGLDNDEFENEDKLQLHFWNRIRDSIGSEFAEFIYANLEGVGEKKILRINCKPSSRPVYVRWKQSGKEYTDEFYVRTGPKTENLDLRKAVIYIENHFSKRQP
jgi:DNA-binding response OmpR family regulator